jgi:hypothetical protein
MNLILETARDEARGFDCNFALTAEQARAMKDHGYEFVVRYLHRGEAHPYDLSYAEMQIILGAKLALQVVQHVESALKWTPSDEKGLRYGQAAAAHAQSLGWLPGALVWCDLEGVDPTVPEEIVISYCNRWHDVVAAAGFLPGIYVGWHCGLSAASLYRRLKFTRYWAAYNLNLDQYPEHRGICMHQWALTAKTRERDVPNGITFQFDVNTVLADKLGGLPKWVRAA